MESKEKITEVLENIFEKNKNENSSLPRSTEYVESKLTEKNESSVKISNTENLDSGNNLINKVYSKKKTFGSNSNEGNEIERDIHHYEHENQINKEVNWDKEESWRVEEFSYEEELSSIEEKEKDDNNHPKYNFDYAKNRLLDKFRDAQNKTGLDNLLKNKKKI